MAELDYIPLSVDLQQLITPDQAWHYRIVPKGAENGTMELFVEEGKHANGLRDELEMLFGKTVHLEPLSDDRISKTLGKYYRRAHKESKAEKVELGINQADDFLSKLLKEAKNLDSSDIHLEAYEDKCRVRMRIDGLLIERYSIPREDYPVLINKIKIKSNLDIAEKRLPQDGRISFGDGKDKIDIRVSVLPTLHGEKAVLRLLNKDATQIDIESLGFKGPELETYLEGTKRPHGIVLISGPTGSGKTTTLYATLKLLNKEKTNVLTIEDPIEYTLEGINQVQLKEAIGLTFASALKTFLRQDPDVIMLGEIRDGETAQMAIRAALTGHLVLSTIHTNSAWGTISRLVDMGVPSYLLANTLNLSVAQRLLRLLCDNCKEKAEFSDDQLPSGFKPESKVEHQYTAEGCDQCHYTGYKGRTAIYEVIGVDSEVAESIKSNKFTLGEDTIKRKGIKPLASGAYKVFAEGKTSLEEVYPILLNQE